RPTQTDKSCGKFAIAALSYKCFSIHFSANVLSTSPTFLVVLLDPFSITSVCEPISSVLFDILYCSGLIFLPVEVVHYFVHLWCKIQLTPICCTTHFEQGKE